jgi:SAM-dependent methyltransferase
MFVESAELYDAIYHFKDYPRECQRLHAIISKAVPDARTILDVACGTGEHAKFLKEHHAIDGVDINQNYLLAARLKNPSGTYSCADMTELDLGRTYDVVTCLFSAIGNVKTIERLESAVDHMARHVKPGGVLIVEPWFSPDQWNPGQVFIHGGEMPDGKVCRMSLSRREGHLSVLDFHYLHGTRQGIIAYSERLELGLFTRTEMTQAFVAAGMDVTYDPDGLMGRGLYIGRQLF